MSNNAILRAAFLSSAALCLSLCTVASVHAQDVGGDVGGGAGIFRAKNPETKKSATKPGTGAKPANRPTASSRANTERIEDLLDKGNEARDARKFADAETAYKEVLKLKPRDARAAVATPRAGACPGGDVPLPPAAACGRVWRRA